MSAQCGVGRAASSFEKSNTRFQWLLSGGRDDAANAASSLGQAPLNGAKDMWWDASTMGSVLE
jgi:hypothetical protein